MGQQKILFSEAEERKRGEDDVKTILLDPSRTLKKFGLTPSTPLNIGIPKAVEWYNNNDITETYTHLKMK